MCYSLSLWGPFLFSPPHRPFLPTVLTVYVIGARSSESSHFLESPPSLADASVQRKWLEDCLCSPNFTKNGVDSMIFLMFISSRCITSPHSWTSCFSVAASLSLSLFQLFMYLFPGLLAGSTAQADFLLHPFRSFITLQCISCTHFLLFQIFLYSVFFFMCVSITYILISLFLLRIFCIYLKI